MTASEEVTGRRVGPWAAARFGRSILELGGNNAAVVTPVGDRAWFRWNPCDTGMSPPVRQGVSIVVVRRRRPSVQGGLGEDGQADLGAVAVDLLHVELGEEVDDGRGDALSGDQDGESGWVGDDEAGGDEPPAAAEEAGRLVEGDVFAVGVVVRGIEGSADIAVG